MYYDIGSFAKYGKLSGNVVEGLTAGKRIAVRTEKKHPADFALWVHNPHHVMQWTAPWGTGYPGWHIECTAMAIKYLGSTMDIHTGGEDNKFPHHECEIAQSEGATKLPFAKFWLHASHLLVDGEKMSKSKGNFYRLDDLLAKGYSPMEVRYLLVSTHYRQPLNFTFQALDAAKSAVERLTIFADAVQGAKAVRGKRAVRAKAAIRAVTAALENDLHVSDAWARIFDYVRETNEAIAQGTLSEGEKTGALDVVKMVNAVFGFMFGQDVEVPESVKALVAQREDARQQQRFVEADHVRDQLKAMGWILEDTAQGVRVRRG